MILTKANKIALPAIYAQDGKGDAAIAYVKFFNGPYTAVVTEFDGAELLFGKVFIGGVTQGAPEWGYINLNELEANGVERDRWFKPKPIGECDGEFAGYTPTATKGGA